MNLQIVCCICLDKSNISICCVKKKNQVGQIIQNNLKLWYKTVAELFSPTLMTYTWCVAV